ncbi:thioesterase family protein [Steroidobacter sp. S1-65]|uniref:Thioesterase family protein n=1 Tax=Steroidobacter gossypii TaxID=2805490 RepID=A0ABS1WSS2_9GAMM|nr:thioesterase family protein [Steroidobacter gossypii]MBM0104014.1 thioesterase family protein [Steroidobacter gossypii]
MQFSEILSSIGATGDECHVTVSDDWLQGRATFGGLVAAVGNEAMRRLVPRDRVLRSLQTTFVGPAGAGTWRIRARVLRVGRAVTLAQCEVLDGDQVVAVQVGVYGIERESAVLVKPVAVESPRKVEEINEVRFDPERAPAFVQHFALRWAQGAKPFSSTRSASKVFIRHRDPSPLTESHIVALVDCIPSPALSMFKAPAPGSSLVWMLEFFEHDLEFGPEAWWRIDSDIDAATGGYVNQTGLLHDPNGRPVALSRQLVAVFG